MLLSNKICKLSSKFFVLIQKLAKKFEIKVLKTKRTYLRDALHANGGSAVVSSVVSFLVDSVIS